MESGTALAERFARSLFAVSHHWKRRLDLKFAHLGLTQARWSVLLALSTCDDTTQIELARTLGIEAATLVRLIDGLEGAGLVARHSSQTDRRAKIVRLTGAATPLIHEMKRIAAENRAALIEGVTQDDLRAATRVLAHIATQLEIMNSDQNG